MAQQIPLGMEARAEEVHSNRTHEIAPDLAYCRLVIANIVFYGRAHANSGEWVLIDAGVFGTRSVLDDAIEQRFGQSSKPAAIILTHGHFDHVGLLEDLAAEWDIPIYAHPLEHPYLNGGAAYPPGDPSVGGGLMAALSSFYPTKPVDVGTRLQSLPEDGSIPCMPGWRWVHTPGHTPGHVSLWREQDGAIIAGDAFVTTAPESVYATTFQTPELHGPPKYFTIDWEKAQASVQELAALEPALVITGHGRAMQGVEMNDALHLLAAEFTSLAIPENGLYVETPARADDGSAYAKP